MTQSVQRVCVRLDPAMLLERLLLTRLSLIPKARRQEWLRGLLVNGYLAEQRTESAATGAEAQKSGASAIDRGRQTAPWSSFSGWIGRRCGSDRHAAEVRPESETIPAVAESPAVSAEGPIRVRSTRDKPFSHLRKVIG
jgi:hypothetical protein